MSYKHLTIYDTHAHYKKDTAAYRPVGYVEVRIPGTDTILFKGYNKIILPGAGFTARAHFDIPRDEITPSYNSALNLENSVNEAPTSKERIYLFCVGTDGCGREGSDIRVVDYAHWISPDDLVPFRYVLESEDLSGADRDMYYGRVIKNDRVAYYFKAFDSVPVLIQKYADGTIVGNDVYDNNKTDEIETYVEITLRISPEDCRDWFKYTTGINDARINTFSLCTAWAKTYDGQIYYQDIRPITKYNIANEHLIELTKGLEITYHVYY